MDYQLAETLQMLIGLTGVTIISVSAMAFWFKKKELDRRADPELEQTIQTLRAEIEEMRAEHTEQITDLNERMDFTERLLARGRDEQAGR